MLQIQRNYIMLFVPDKTFAVLHTFFRPVFNQPCYFIGASSIVALNWVAVYAILNKRRQDCGHSKYTASVLTLILSAVQLSGCC